MTSTSTDTVATPTKGKKSLDILLVAAVGVSAALPFLLAPFRAMILGPVGRGEFAFFQSSVSIIGLACTLGLRLACYQLGLFGDRRFLIRYPSLILASIGFGSVVAIPSALVAFLSVSTTVAYFILGALALCVGYAFSQIEVANAQHGLLRNRVGATSAFPALLEFIVSIVLILWQRLSLLACLITTFLAEVLRGGLAIIWNRREARQQETTPEKISNKMLLRASIISAPAAVVPLLSGNIDVLIFGALLDTSTLGHYVVAKLGFSVMLLVGTVLEGRAISLAGRLGYLKASFAVAAFGGVCAALGGTAGFLLTPVIFGQEFVESARAFPFAAAAGFFAYMFVSLTAMSHCSSRASMRSAELVPAVIVLVGIVSSCCAIPVFFGSNVIAMSLGLMFSQVLGVISIALFSILSRRSSHA